MMNKRATHVGMILSFVVFIVFVIFLYDILEPVLQRDESKANSLEYLNDRLVEEFTEKVTTVTIRINESFGFANSCFDLVEEDIISLFSEDNFVIKDESENPFPYSVAGNLLRIDSNKKFFKIYVSDGFTNLPVSIVDDCDVLEGYYSIGNIRDEESIFVSKVLELNESYHGGYENLKKDLELPLDVEFGFSVEYEGGIIKAGDSGNAEEVYAERLPIQYMDTKANLNYGNLTISIW